MSIYIHAMERARERYGIALSPRDLDVMAERIRGKNSVRLEIQASNREIHIVGYGGRGLRVVYQRDTESIVTVLPMAGCKVRRRK